LSFIDLAFIVPTHGHIGSALEAGIGPTGFDWNIVAACRIHELEMPRVLDALRIRPFCAHTAKMRPVWREIIQGLFKWLRLHELGGRSAIQSSWAV
jgi:hypothetical protein